MTVETLVERVLQHAGAHWARPLDAATRGDTITGVEHDSRQVVRGTLFVALRGQKVDGTSFVSQAAAQGAMAVVAETDPPADAATPWLVVPDARRALADLSAAFYGDPSHALSIVGVTGTNGKTTTTYLIAAMCERAGLPCGRIGTVSYLVGKEERRAPHTTPEANEVHHLLREMVDAGLKACAMEVSSHALALQRVGGVRFRAAVFTNLTRDHLDFHGDMNAYFLAKRKLFEMLPVGASAIVNVDDPWGRHLSETIPTALTYGLDHPADISATRLELTLGGASFLVRTPRDEFRVESALPGRPNVYNALAAVGVGVALGLGIDEIARGLADVRNVPGRFQVVSQPADDVTVVVDYAHTDDALRNLLETVRALTSRRVIVVFGCGGDRDRTKRPLMGAVAARLADLVVLTSDNPRSEDPDGIIDEIKKGLVLPAERTAALGARGGQPRETPWLAITDRRAAIERAILEASPGDVVLVAGKGHETYQVLGTKVLPFDDVAVSRDVLSVRRSRSKVS